MRRCGTRLAAIALCAIVGLGVVAAGQTVTCDPEGCTRLRNEIADLKVAIAATEVSIPIPIPIVEYDVGRAYWSCIRAKSTTRRVKAVLFENAARLVYIGEKATLGSLKRDLRRLEQEYEATKADWDYACEQV